MRMTAQVWVHVSVCAAVLLTITAVFLVTPVLADDSWHGGDGRSASAVALDNRIAAGDLKYRDPSSGEVVVATPEQVAALRQDLAPLFDWPEVFPQEIRSDGTVRIIAEGQVRDVYFARTNIDGSRDYACVNNLDAAVAFLIGADGAHDGGVQPRRPVVN